MSGKKNAVAIAAVLTTMIPAQAHADVGVPMIAFLHPMFILTLIPVILLETEIYRRRLAMSYKKLLLAVAAGNAFSALIGYPLSWHLLARLYANWPEKMLPDFLNRISNRTLAVIDGPWWWIPVGILIGLIPAYLISVYAEGFIIQKVLKQDRRVIFPISWRANLWSYGFLVVVVLGWLSYTFLHPTPSSPPEWLEPYYRVMRVLFLIWAP
ncbi:MAG: hypothetical protein WC728_13560 [Elusimicrobiota bacterium]